MRSEQKGLFLEIVSSRPRVFEMCLAKSSSTRPLHFAPNFQEKGILRQSARFPPHLPITCPERFESDKLGHLWSDGHICPSLMLSQSLENTASWGSPRRRCLFLSFYDAQDKNTIKTLAGMFYLKHFFSLKWAVQLRTWKLCRLAGAVMESGSSVTGVITRT